MLRVQKNRGLYIIIFRGGGEKKINVPMIEEFYFSEKIFFFRKKKKLKNLN